MTFKQNDRVKYKAGTIAAAGPPDRRKSVGTVIAAHDLTGFANMKRIDVLFDGENIPQNGLHEALFDLA